MLFFFDLTEGRAQELAEAAEALGLPNSLLSAWAKALPGADAIGLAVRTDLTSVRLYTQYWDLQVARLEAGKSDLIPLYRGFKALPGGSVRQDDYICLPAAPRSLFWPDMSQALAGIGLDTEAVETAFAPLDAESCIYTRTAAPDRNSWLATVRRADLDRHAVAQALAPLATGAARPVAKAAQAHDLVHVAGGSDDVKGGFTTFYFQVDPDHISALFSGSNPSPGN